ncbi:MAG: AarF/ABC1/UbiB kinase family protein, partial [Myxococcales bacterium]|nr:AarF/ABC1/UbiB kinase family protein [Myxococcales bacterium]
MQFTTLMRIPQTYKNLARLREILGVVVKYGGGDLVARLELEGYLELGRNLLRFQQTKHEVARFTTEQRIRMAFEELGPTFIKLGQILATRPDLIPMPLVVELRQLQDNVPPFSPAASKRQIEEELGKPVEELFARFEEQPLAAASIAQVHRATLKTGEEVVIKVRRPNLAEIIKTDLDIMGLLAEMIDKNIPESRQYDPVGMARQFARSILVEIDLSHEAFNIHKFARNFEGDPHIHVPRVFDEFSTDKILTMEFIQGIKASHIDEIVAAGMDRSELSRIAIDFVMRQTFVHGFFHADPHPGNIFILPNHVIAPIDMGMMGTLDQEMIDNLLELIVGIVLRDIDKILKLFQKLDLIDEAVDFAGLRKDGQELLDRYSTASLVDVD